MKTVLFDDEWRANLRQRGFTRARCFSWEATARLTREVYAEAIARFRRKT
jgi:hypothetical protein